MVQPVQVPGRSADVFLLEACKINLPIYQFMLQTAGTVTTSINGLNGTQLRWKEFVELFAPLFECL